MADYKIDRPVEGEYVPYFDRYVSLVADGDIIASLGAQLEETLALLSGIPESRAGFRYAPDKWSMKELVGHMIDSERIFAYRALRFARNDQTPLPGYEQDDYIRNGSFDSCSLADLAAEFESVRRSTLYLFKHLDREAWTRRGSANDSEASVRALAYIIAGHELHHREVLRTRYVAAGADD
ncbi:MAG TPA: DinB family protein [Pyrinomonadaceae bacterium]|nr:DinB family protein [Pyrinomonadaceae bacterium]